MSTTREARREYAERPGYLLNLALLQADKNGKWLAKAVGATDAQVSNWRKGIWKPRKQRQRQIAAALSEELGRKITPTELGWED